MNVPNLFTLIYYASQKRANLKSFPSSFYKKEIDEYNNYDDNKIDVAMEYANMLTELEQSYNVLLGDFVRIANWGVYEGNPVIIDLGYTENTKVYYLK